MIAAHARAWVGLAAIAVALAAGATASASTSVRPAPGTPDPRLMVLTSADLKGARVAEQGYEPAEPPFLISYGRVFDGGRSGGSSLLAVASVVAVGANASAAARSVASSRAEFASKKARDEFVFELDTGEGGPRTTRTTVSRPRNLGAGRGSFDITVTSREARRTIEEIHFSLFRVDRVVGLTIVVGMRGKRVPLATMTRLAKIMTARMKAELAPKPTALPTVSGSAGVGQTLGATTGTWGNKPTGFAYQWLRCDSAGGSCTGITGATAQTYVVVDADAGATLRVAVTATNASGSKTATSAASAVVQATGAPVSASPPTITGTAQVGQTLTAGTGAWTGAPTSFAFQWQRCDASGASCLDIGGATGGTYVVSSSDVGSTIRVVVTARNSLGTTAAPSAPTGVVT